jgi:B-box zinc finger
MTEPMRCYRHPERETRVSCATCGRPICTECMVPTEVGIKCPDDARLPRGARAGVMKRGQVLKSLLAGVVVALVGVPVAYAIFQVGFLTFILSAVAGWGAGTFVHRAGGRNGGPLAMVISGVAVAVAYAPLMVQPLLNGNFPVFVFLPALVAVGLAVYNSR